MKRNSITGIIGKVQILTYRVHHFGLPNHYNSLIRKAAVNEILRLDSAQVPSVHDLANSPGAASAFDQIADVLSNIPGPGYEFLKNRKI